MPVSPLFALVSPTTNSNPLSQPITGKAGVLGPVQSSSLSADTTSNGANGLNFFDQLQAASELASMPIGQEFAAYLPHTYTLDDNHLEDLNPDFMGPPALQPQVYIHSDESSVLYAQNIQPDTLQSSEGDAPQGLQYLESLRRAQPHFQVQTQSSAPLDSEETDALDMKGVLTDANGQVKIAPSDLAMRQGSQGEPEKLLEPIQQAVNPLAGMAAQNSKMINLDELGMESVLDDVSLDGLELEDTSIHEQPKTLSVLKENSAAPVTQTQEPSLMQDVKAGTADAVLNGLKDANPAKSMALDQTDTSKTQMSEKFSTTFNKLDVPPQHPQWNDQVAKRISIMASESVQTARIQLDPPELGSLEVKIKVQNDQVSVAFGSNNQTVRDALEAQSPRLRELLEQQGINLADVNVSEQGREQQGQNTDDGLAGDGEIAGDLSDSDLTDEQAVQSMESDSLVDYFA